MEQFTNVTCIKKANVYFDGRVNSRTILFENNEKKTLGFMMAGEYVFHTNTRECMEVLNGEMIVTLPNEQPRTYQAHEQFYVPANSDFIVLVNQFADYLCSYE